MQTDNSTLRNSAIEDYYRARQQARLRDILARLRGKQEDLISYEAIQHKVKSRTILERGIQTIPMDHIIGSVNRYQDFTRGFLPRQAISRDRWARVEQAMIEIGLPPIDVYQIGQVYFVKDGNHRVAVGKRLGLTHIEAHVEEVPSRVALTPDVSPDELILQAEHAGFLASTRLPEVRPQAQLELTAPGQYPKLEAHISAHRPAGKLGDFEIDEIFGDWYDTVYQPAADYIEKSGLLKEFPGRTVTDLYMWILEHRADLEEQFGQEIRTAAAARDLTTRRSPRLRRILARIGSNARKVILPKRLETGPTPGSWRREKSTISRLFSDILVTINGKESGWNALSHAIEVARREGANLNGLHVLRSEKLRSSPQAQEIEVTFDRLCEEGGVTGNLIITAGKTSAKIGEQSRWNDLLVVNLTYPAHPRQFARLSTGFLELIQHCPGPVLAIPRRRSPLSKVLLAYDGSPKAREALYISAYLASDWKLPLVVITVFDKNVSPETLADAWEYLESHEIDATYVKSTGPVIQEILITREEQGCDLILMGGYGHNPAFDLVLGNTVAQVLRESLTPILICR